MQDNSLPYELVVIGAGPHGLIAAHTWLELYPESRVAILEAEEEVGGTWAKGRIYPGMMTQSPVGKIEFSCYPMPPPETTFLQLMSGSHVSAYLEAFSQHKSWAGKSLRDRVKFKFDVDSVSWAEIDGARLYTIRSSSGESVTCRKLMVATGLTNIPYLPAFKIEEGKEFLPPIIHCKYLAKNADFLLSPAVQKVVVLGGAKSAFDTVQMLINGGKEVTWIIRADGAGPACMGDPKPPPIFGLKNSSELVSTRFVSKLSPSIFEPVDAWARLWHQSKIGIAISAFFWRLITLKWWTAAGYDRDERLLPLKPDRPVYYVQTLGIANAADTWETVAKAKVVRKGIERLSGRDVVLSGGEEVACDALIACTGWDAKVGFFSTEQSAGLGLPVDLKEESVSDRKHWEALIEEADKEVLLRFPRLEEQPAFPTGKGRTSSAKLYRCMVPTNPEFNDGSILFLGHFITRDTMTLAEIQALWAVAHMNGKLSKKTEEEMEEDVALVIAWRRRRYLGDGHTFLFDGHEYYSQLLRDLGINDVRKSSGWREIFSPYDVHDYRGLIDEYKAL
ncbi:FAD/NAD(P)-binding domain-containing protein [Hyaloscypha variabilis F]|uniref:FAD/NAD(P)-binding domain-containing protein n=1 Tax=Hyaloscypha variabilis (strain UAMH 11265 / GT02V1 / F) TaxID=1149755 RepID=A0A2J6RJQ3_HYAVF|nr:FAD/NAD(P)-binding domain-containing protein [Hyaloscypha variabilis F]